MLASLVTVQFSAAAQSIGNQKDPAPITRLQAEASEAKRLATALRSAADKVDDSFHIGTAFNEVDVSEHTCYALGVFLGKDKYVSHLRFNRKPSLAAADSDAAHELRVTAQSMDNFETAVKQVAALKQEQRVVMWNLDCAGHMRISAIQIPQAGVATFYELTNQGKGLRVLGAVEAGFASKIREAFEKNPKIEFVSLGSGGGFIYEALSAGRFLRSKGIATTIWNNCYSACPLVFMGGKERHIHSPYPSLGFHQIYSRSGAAPPDSKVYVDVASYLQEMGVKSRFVVQSMLIAPPTAMNLISGADKDLCANKVATWIQRVCSVE
ncbi:hypothetical protein [Pseudorhodoferax sp.]|uniref:COG3904 family protein n=1 Tax=Pseudorhodoferax sp. TaxID=1993553 RepID=UPI002DD621E5|nr:hypothetical protein [Pseudorhodoferax sp.]